VQVLSIVAIDVFNANGKVGNMKFSELDLNPLMLQALQKMNYTDLTPIQEQTFPHILSGKDLLATAETGSGKTSACSIPLVQRIVTSQKEIQALILVPTRELALQYVEEIDKIVKTMDVKPFAIYGGFSMEIQKAKLLSTVHILVATPGRLIDMIYSGYISLSSVAALVLDEADEMLKLGFLEDINFIFSCLIHEHQTLLFSSTMPEAIRKLTKKYLHDPVIVELNVNQVAPQSLEHQFALVRTSDRLTFLIDYVNRETTSQVIIFCNSRHSGEKLFSQLKGKVKSVEIIHGGLEQSKRTAIIRRFRRHSIDIMVATDLAGRGLDFVKVSHIINYNFPQNPETYTNRTGRAARMGRPGIALTLVSTQELRSLKRILAVNKITPVWLGKEPDWAKVSQQSKGHSGSGRRRKPRRPGQSYPPSKGKGAGT
jgi:ATP-dependent RNA helicase DeaD